MTVNEVPSSMYYSCIAHRYVEELAAHLETLCRDAKLRRKMGEAGRWRVVQRYTTQHMAHQYEDLHKALLSCAVHPKDHG